MPPCCALFPEPTLSIRHSQQGTCVNKLTELNSSEWSLWDRSFILTSKVRFIMCESQIAGVANREHPQKINAGNGMSALRVEVRGSREWSDFSVQPLASIFFAWCICVCDSSQSRFKRAIASFACAVATPRSSHASLTSAIPTFSRPLLSRTRKRPPSQRSSHQRAQISSVSQRVRVTREVKSEE